MSESSDYDPGPWTGRSFATARRAYDDHVAVSYSKAVAAGIDPKDCVVPKLETKSKSPVVILCDVTGSMGDWPATIFSKLPYLDKEGQEYLGEDMEISFAAIGDQFCDQYPLQVRPFSKGLEMEKELKKFIVEGGGGGQTNESYDLGALYYANNVEMPNAQRPILIFIGDEGIYDFLDKEGSKKWANVEISKQSTVEAIFAKLQQKWAVYVVRKPYGDASETARDPSNIKIQHQWEKMLGEDHVIILPEAGRVVDVIFGIFAKETNREDYFKKEITDRQKPDQVRTVMKALNSIHTKASPAKMLRSGASITRRKGAKDDEGKDSISLL